MPIVSAHDLPLHLLSCRIEEANVEKLMCREYLSKYVDSKCSDAGFTYLQVGLPPSVQSTKPAWEITSSVHACEYIKYRIQAINRRIKELEEKKSVLEKERESM